MRLFCERLDGWSAPVDAFVALHVNDENSFWLDREHSADDRFSVVGSGLPVERFERPEVAEDLPLPFSFRPGFVGAFGYDEGLSVFFYVDRALVFDHESRAIWFIGVFEHERDFEHWRQAALLRLALVGGETAAYKNAQPAPSFGKPTLRHTPSEYLQLIERAQQHIAEGDVYQLCLTNELVAGGKADPLMTFITLRELNPTPYATYLKFGDNAIVCTSPEQFLRVSSDRYVSSKPIKGTRRRESDPVLDAEIARELALNEKERAENLMIVDLMRNDIGRVCEPESISVPKLFEVETYKTVHQLVSTVVGRLLPDKTFFDAIESAFPGGSMTGAPKARAMEIIAELERGNRGFYSGALGYIGFNGAVDLGMTIRTIVFEGDTVRIGIGGGITIDSDPREELEETRLKAKALMQALGLEDPWAW